MDTPGTKYVVPNPRIPKVIGILNIVFASSILICGLCSITSMIVRPFVMRALETAQKEAEAKRRASLAALDEQEKSAATEQEKEHARAQKRQIQSTPQPLPPGFDPDKLGLQDPRMTGFVWSELTSGLVLNVAMLAAGIGLVMRTRWAPSVGTWVAGLKIARLVLLYAYCIVVVVPLMARIVVKMMEAMSAQQQAMGAPAPPMPPPALQGRISSITYTAYAVGMILFGSIYPAVTIWLLNKPGARAACSGSQTSLGPGDTW